MHYFVLGLVGARSFANHREMAHSSIQSAKTEGMTITIGNHHSDRGVGAGGREGGGTGGGHGGGDGGGDGGDDGGENGGGEGGGSGGNDGGGSDGGGEGGGFADSELINDGDGGD